METREKVNFKLKAIGGLSALVIIITWILSMFKYAPSFTTLLSVVFPVCVISTVVSFFVIIPLLEYYGIIKV